MLTIDGIYTVCIYTDSTEYQTEYQFSVLPVFLHAVKVQPLVVFALTRCLNTDLDDITKMDPNGSIVRFLSP